MIIIKSNALLGLGFIPTKKLQYTMLSKICIYAIKIMKKI